MDLEEASWSQEFRHRSTVSIRQILSAALDTMATQPLLLGSGEPVRVSVLSNFVWSVADTLRGPTAKPTTDR